LSFPVSPAESLTAERRIVDFGAGPDAVRIGIHPGGRGSKRWPVDRFVDLVRRTRGAGRRIILFHGPGEEALVQAFPKDDVLVLPRMPLREFAAAISRCDLFVSSDTGPMHLAVAVGVPTVALFNVGNSDMFGPRGPRNRVIDRPGGASVDEVSAAVEEVIAG